MYLFEDHFLTEGADAIGGRGGVSVRAHTHTDKAVFQRWRILLLIGVKLFALSGHAQKRHPKHRGGLREVDVNLLEWFAVTRPPLRLASALRARLGECNAKAWSTHRHLQLPWNTTPPDGALSRPLLMCGFAMFDHMQQKPLTVVISE